MNSIIHLGYLMNSIIHLGRLMNSIIHLGYLINPIIHLATALASFGTFDKSFKYSFLFSDLILYNKVYYYIKHKCSLFYINKYIF